MGEIERIPIAKVKLIGTSLNDEVETLFEYELPLNFKHDCKLSPTFYSLKSKNEQYFGFLFANANHKDSFVWTMKQLYDKLRKGRRQI